MKKLGCLVIFVVVGFFAFKFNPTKEEHAQNAVKLLKEIGVENYGINKDYLAIGEGLLGKERMEDLMGKFITRKNYFFFSLTAIDVEGDEQIIALGLFGHFFDLGDMQNIKKKLEVE